jgi:hypothetical protein
MELEEEVSEIPTLGIRLNRPSHYPPTVERSVTTAKRNITPEGLSCHDSMGETRDFEEIKSMYKPVEKSIVSVALRLC